MDKESKELPKELNEELKQKLGEEVKVKEEPKEKPKVEPKVEPKAESKTESKKEPKEEITNPKLKRLEEIVGLIKEGMVTQEDMQYGRNQAGNRHAEWYNRTRPLHEEYLSLVKEIYPNKSEMCHIDFLRERGNISPREMKPKIVHTF